jgi:hypothetical protein
MGRAIHTDIMNILGEGNIKKVVVKPSLFADDYSAVFNIPLFMKKVLLKSGDDATLSKVSVDNSECPREILQFADNVYLLTSTRNSASREYVSISYHLRKFAISGSTAVDTLPSLLASFTYSTSEIDPLFGMFNDGSQNKPYAVFEIPKISGGYRNHFVEDYSRIFAVDLDSNKRHMLSYKAMHATAASENETCLVSLTIPTSTAHLMILENREMCLENVFQHDDLKKVDELNRMKQEYHKRFCTGTASCMNDTMFESVSSKDYPKYKLTVDMKGNVIKAEREPSTIFAGK